MLQLTRSGAVLPPEAERDQLRAEFERCHLLRLPHLLEPGLLSSIQSQLENAEFEERVHAGIGQELCMRENLVLHILHLLSNDPRFIELVEDISGLGSIGSFQGRVYRVVPGSGHYDSWHDDLAEPRRLVAMSLNLGREVFSGSVFELRDWRTQQTLGRVANTGSGDAILFRLARYLKHHITPIEGRVVKTAFAGWFQSQPDFRTMLRQQLQEAAPESDAKC